MRTKLTIHCKSDLAGVCLGWEMCNHVICLQLHDSVFTYEWWSLVAAYAQLSSWYAL